MADLGPVPGANMADLARCVRRDPSGDTEEMGILHVDSSLEAARAEAAKVLGYMAAEGFEVERVGTSGWVGRGWDEVFDENEIDIVLAGDYPGGAAEGERFARGVIRRNPLIDVLMYGLGGIRASVPEDFSQYTAIQTHGTRAYSGAAVEMIRMHRQKWNDVIFLRGMVVSQIVDVESRINEALAAYFRMEPGRGGHFEELVLENSLYSLEGKKQTLKGLTKRLGIGEEWSGMDGMLSHLQSTRNKMAHCEVDPDDINRITSMGKTYHYDRRSMRKILKSARGARRRLERITSVLARM